MRIKALSSLLDLLFPHWLLLQQHLKMNFFWLSQINKASLVLNSHCEGLL